MELEEVTHRIPMDKWAQDTANELRDKLASARARRDAGHTHEWDRYDITPRAWSGQTPEAMAKAFAILMRTVQVSRLEVERMSLIAYAVPNVIVKGGGDFATRAKEAIDSVLWPATDAKWPTTSGPIDPSMVVDLTEPTITQEHANRVLTEYPDADLSRLKIVPDVPSEGQPAPAVVTAAQVEANGLPCGIEAAVGTSAAQTTDLVFEEIARTIGARVLAADVPSWTDMQAIIIEGQRKSRLDRTYIRWGIVDGRFEYSWTYIDGITGRPRGF